MKIKKCPLWLLVNCRPQNPRFVGDELLLLFELNFVYETRPALAWL